MLSKHFEFSQAEKRWYEFWQRSGFFQPDLASSKPPFCIVIPPPNVTGILHMGHGLDNVLQDTLIRYKRMCGFNTLWVVGTDHAGIATQNVVERELRREKKRKEDLGRDAFVKLIWDWKQKHHSVITEQIQKMGASCDWTRERFTLDAGLSEAVTEVFVRLYEEGLIYRGERITNWCPRCQTAISDLEVIPKETKGALYHIRYPIAGASDSDALIVATTRPETLLGDTAVAVNPGDSRFRHHIGGRATLPLLGRLIPIIGDDYVDMEFGTGALKVTPGHDFNDFEIGTRHGLPSITILDKTGHLNDTAGPYCGLTVSEARTRVLEDLQAQGLLVQVAEHVHSVGHCQRCDTVAEPLITLQWFLNVSPMAKAAQAAVDAGHTRIIPENWKRTWDDWLSNIRDWCISRQLWWGHRIPAYSCASCGHVAVSRETPSGKCPHCANDGWIQDSDVLDTWFSSALWPFSTLGWPKQTPELSVFYPTSVLVTGFDIIFFWVARMMMMGLKFTGTVPFKDVYLHALVLDAAGKKMSKSSGNALDPIAVIDKFGADAFRFCMLALSAQGRSIRLSENKFEGYRNFVNKIWNASKLVLSQLTDSDPPPLSLPKLIKSPDTWATADRYIVSRLLNTERTVSEALERYEFDVAANALYQFIWNEFCDWYLEAAKFAFYGKLGSEARQRSIGVALGVLERSMRLLHPFMPFVTEELWQALPDGLRSGPSVMVAACPRGELLVSSSETDIALRRSVGHFELLTEVITGIRNVRGEHVIPHSANLNVTFVTPDPDTFDLLREHSYLLNGLCTATTSAATRAPKSSFMAHIALSAVDVFIDLEGVVDRDSERRRLEKELEKSATQIARLEAKLGNSSFVKQAPSELVDRERSKLDEERARHQKLVDAQRRLG